MSNYFYSHGVSNGGSTLTIASTLLSVALSTGTAIPPSFILPELNKNINTKSGVSLRTPPVTNVANDSWRGIDINSVPSYMVHTEFTDHDKINTVMNFSKSIIENMQDIDGDILHKLNEKFWDLI